MIKDSQQDWPTDKDMTEYLELMQTKLGCVSIRQTPDSIKKSEFSLKLPGQHVEYEATRYVSSIWPVAKLSEGKMLLVCLIHQEQLSFRRYETIDSSPPSVPDNKQWTRNIYHYSFTVHEELLDQDHLIVLNGTWMNQEAEYSVPIRGIIFSDLYEARKNKQIDLYNKLKHLQDVDGNPLIPVLEDLESENNNEKCIELGSTDSAESDGHNGQS